MKRFIHVFEPFRALNNVVSRVQILAWIIFSIVSARLVKWKGTNKSKNSRNIFLFLCWLMTSNSCSSSVEGDAEQCIGRPIPSGELLCELSCKNYDAALAWQHRST